ncbi:MAG TPA: glycosyltransferase family 39 protein [Polyangia bacterium]|nr:glycosyltransferase family 39 protein [Polyangia bacterium]
MGLLLTALAIAVRLLWVLVVPTRPVGDFAMYLESARYLCEHHALDPEFIYMPGYVYLAAGVYAFGGGLLAVKMIGVASGALATAAAYGIARAIFGRGAAFTAGLLCALWPAGIAVSSVTGTDMPAAALLGLAVWLLARNAARRPLGAPAAFGLVMGLASYIRAVALPLVLLAALHFRARGASWLHVFTRTVAAAAVAFLVLLPWGLRNHHRYGELFFTDSHGGHTALVGANPDSDGSYSRSLNRMFSEGTGYALFAPPHRESDRVAYALAKQWTAFSPRYALGLLVAKADRLLGAERPLLYWPLYRQSVLPSGTWFDVHRAGVERLVDDSYYLMIAAVVMGIVAAAGGRNWPALTLLPLPLALLVLYTLFFAEARYHLAVVVLLLPFAGQGLAWVVTAARDLLRRPDARRRLAIEALVAGGLVALIFVGWPRLTSAGTALRERNRWAVCVCEVAGAKRLCDVRATDPPPGEAPSPVRGVWDGFGLRLSGARAAAAFDLDLPPGRYRISMRAEAVGPAVRAAVDLAADGTSLAQASWPTVAMPVTLTGTVPHASGKLHVELGTSRGIPASTDGEGTLWISAIRVEPDRP